MSTMSGESQRPPLQSLWEAEQPPPTPPADAGDSEEEGEPGKEAEKAEDSAAPSTSPSYDAALHLSYPFPTPSSRKTTGRRKKSALTPKQRAAAEKKLVLLNANFHPVPFSPGKTLDFSAHEQVFQALGLWDFVHLEFDREVRPDLLVHLIAYYDPANRRSYVHGSRVSVSRSDLARALGLPVKKGKAIAFEGSDESAGVLLEFMSNYIPYGDDMCILPTEIMQATQFVKEGMPQKVDWGTLMWVLVEKELSDAPKYGACHCASHLQHLIKHQQPHLFSMSQGPVLEALAGNQEEEVSAAEAEVPMAVDEANVVEEVFGVAEEEDDCCDANALKAEDKSASNSLFCHQQPHLFPRSQGPVLDVLVGAQEELVSVVGAEVSKAEDEANVVEDQIAAAHEEDDSCDANAMKVRSFEELGNGGPDDSNAKLELTLGEDENGLHRLEDCKVGEHQQWPEERDNEGFEHCLRPCNSKYAEGINFQNLTNNVCELEGQGMDHADDFSEKFSNLGGLSSSDLQTMPNTSVASAQQLNAFTAASGEILTMCIEPHKNVMLNHGPNDSLYSENNRKRQACDAEEGHFEHSQPKRMRASEPWDNMAPSFDDCMENIYGSAERARILYAEKDQAIVNMQMEMQYMTHTLQAKEKSIRSLKMMVEEQQHWQMMIHNYEHELKLMAQMLLGYKKALKETQSRFTDYRKKHGQDDVTLYKDVPGTGGLVLSERDLKKYQLEKQEAVLQELLGIFGSLDNVLMKFKGSEERIMIHNKKLTELAGEMKQLKGNADSLRSSHFLNI